MLPFEMLLQGVADRCSLYLWQVSGMVCAVEGFPWPHAVPGHAAESEMHSSVSAHFLPCQNICFSGWCYY